MVSSPDVYESSSGESVSETVIRAVADAKGIDPLDMDACLFDAIDPGALDTIFAADNEGTERRVSFTFAGYRVAVNESQTVFLTDLEKCVQTDSTETPNSTDLRGARFPWQLVF